MQVVATAGHVDHGKSTLVRALTGTDPDRLTEERRRGLTIELGYAWTDLPPVGQVAFVDVPGHERFIATALAGLGPVPVAMLVVAADDGWMPQTAEHLAVLEALGVRHGLLVITRADLADPAPALGQAREALAGTGLAHMPAVVASGHTGAGLDRLREVLGGVLGGVPGPDPSADVRLWVDRRFHIKGAGTVVTGTLPAGTIRAGEQLAAGSQQVRVRGVESLGRPCPSATGVARVALNLAASVPDSLTRGTALTTPGAFLPTREADVRLIGPERVPERPLLHLGSAAVGVRTRRLGGGFYRLRLDAALPLRVADRGVLRDPGSRRLWGLEVLDPLPPVLERRGSAVERATTLGEYDATPAAELRRRGVVRRSDLIRIGAPVDPLPDGAVAVGDWLIGADRASELRDRLRTAVDAAGGQLAIPEAAQALDLPDPVIVAALAVGWLPVAAGRVGTARRVEVDPAVQELQEELASAPFAAPTAQRLAELGLDRSRIGRLHRDGLLLRVADGIVLLPGADRRAADLLADLDQPFTVSTARQALGTSRRVVLALLAHLDATGATVRLPDDRRRVRRG